MNNNTAGKNNSFLNNRIPATQLRYIPAYWIDLLQSEQEMNEHYFRITLALIGVKSNRTEKAKAASGSGRRLSRRRLENKEPLIARQGQAGGGGAASHSVAIGRSQHR